MQLFRSIATIGFYTMGSRVLGFVRTALMSSFLGATAASDAINIAIKLPSMLRRLFAEGAFSVAFVPIYSELVAKKGQAEEFASSIFNVLFSSLILITIVAEIFMPEILSVMAFGFSGERLELAITLTRITFPLIVFISLCAFYGGILNSYDRFAAFASSPMAGNLAIIIVACSLLNYIKPSFAFAYAVLACGIVQFLWVYVPARMMGFRFKIKKPKLTKSLRKFWSKLLPAAAGSGIVQINLFVGSMIASNLDVGGVSLLVYADRLVQLPISVIGTAVGTALLPLLSKYISQGNIKKAQESQMEVVKLSLLLTLPAMAGLISLAHPLVSVLLERGAFGVSDSVITAKTLAMFVYGLPAYVLIKVFSSVFFAQQDTKVPLRAAMVSLVVDIAISVILINDFQTVGIAFATMISGWVNVFILIFVLYKRKFFVLNKDILVFALKCFFIAFVTFLILVQVRDLMNAYVEGNALLQGIGLVAMIGFGFGIFVFGSNITGLMTTKDLMKKFKKQ